MEALRPSTEEADALLARKKRRRSSAGKIFLGDYLDCFDAPKVRAALEQYDGDVPLFADEVLKVNKRNKMQKRVLLVSSRALYNMDRGFKCKRRIPLSIVEELCLSEHDDNFFAIRVPSEYDYLFVSARKSEAVATIVKAAAAAGAPLKRVRVSDRFAMRLGGVERELHFTPTVSGTIAALYTRGDE